MIGFSFFSLFLLLRICSQSSLHISNNAILASGTFFLNIHKYSSHLGFVILVVIGNPSTRLSPLSLQDICTSDGNYVVTM